MSSSDEERIHAIIRDQQDAWNRGDAKAFAAHFDESGTFTNILGEVYYGHGPFEDRHTRILSTIFKGSSVCMTVRRLHFPASGIAVVDIDTEIAGYQALPPGVRPTTAGVLQTRLLEVLVRRHNEWSVVAYHNVDLKRTAQL